MEEKSREGKRRNNETFSLYVRHVYNEMIAAKSILFLAEKVNIMVVEIRIRLFRVTLFFAVSSISNRKT